MYKTWHCSVHWVIHCTVNFTVKGRHSGLPFFLTNLSSLPSCLYTFPAQYTMFCTLYCTLYCTILITTYFKLYCTLYCKSYCTKMAYSFRNTTFPASFSMYCIFYCTLYYTHTVHSFFYNILYTIQRTYIQFADWNGFFSKKKIASCFMNIVKFTLQCTVYFIVHSSLQCTP